jgi:hypothetical protein
MKIKNGFMLRKIVDVWVVVPLGERVVDFNGILKVSESGALLWKKLTGAGATRDEMLADLLSVYEVDAETATRDLDEFLGSLTQAGLLES